MEQSHFQTIVVGVDFSKYSKIVVKQAIQLAKTQEANLAFVHTVRNSDFMSADAPYMDLDQELIKPLTQQLVKFYNLKKVAPHSQVIVNLGWASDGIISAAKACKTPLIVIGHKGKTSAVTRFFLGSTAEQLALHSPFPVWIHRGETAKIPKRILLPSDFSKRATISFDVARALNGAPIEKCEFFHVVQQPTLVLDATRYKQIVEDLRNYETTQQAAWNKKFPEVPLVCKNGDAAPLITKESKKFDLIAMAPHNRKGIFSAFGSVTAKVIRQGNTPILIAH